MTKHYKFEVIVHEHSEKEKRYKFKTMKEICEFLEISYGSVYNLRRGRLKFKHYNKTHLKDIKIIKLDFEKIHYKAKKAPLKKEDEFAQELEVRYFTTSG